MESLGKHIEDALPAELPPRIGKLEEAKGRMSAASVLWDRLPQGPLDRTGLNLWQAIDVTN
jgi:hypothetical protein